MINKTMVMVLVQPCCICHSGHGSQHDWEKVKSHPVYVSIYDQQCAL